MPEMMSGIILEVQLQHVRPAVMRRLEVPTTLTFQQLHEVLQTAIGWQDEHLFEFGWGPIMITAPDDEVVFGDTVWNAEEHTLVEIEPHPGDVLKYVYDFGDNWTHTLQVDAYAPAAKRPRVISGMGGCPPEDVGGPSGYQNFLKAMSDPRHPEHKEFTQWSRDRYFPDYDLNVANDRLRQAFPS